MAVLVAALLLSCAPQPRIEVPDLYWPLPPQKPRIKYVDMIVGSIDVTGSRSDKFSRVLFGEESEIMFGKPLFNHIRGDVLYVSDFGSIHIFDFGKKKHQLLGMGTLSHPTGIVSTAKGDVFVGDSGKKNIYLLKKGTRTFKPLETRGIINSPGGLAVDDVRGRVVAADVKNHNIRVYDLDGKHLFTFGVRGSGPGELNFPYDLDIDAQGRIYVVDSGNFRVQVFNSDGKYLYHFGSVGTLPGQFARPKGIALDTEGHIYVVDAAFGNYQIFNPDGSALMSVGSNGPEPGQFTLPADISINKEGRIYVTDQLNSRVQIFQYIKYQDE